MRAHGGEPIVIPAMGNHGGATDDGQAEILAGLGVTEATVGATIHRAMTTKQVAVTASGVPVYVAGEALEADGVVLVNRIKPHTDFESTIIQKRPAEDVRDRLRQVGRGGRLSSRGACASASRKCCSKCRRRCWAR